MCRLWIAYIYRLVLYNNGSRLNGGNEQNPTETDSNPFRYCGEYFDGETGSIYLRARYAEQSANKTTIKQG